MPEDAQIIYFEVEICKMFPEINDFDLRSQQMLFLSIFQHKQSLKLSQHCFAFDIYNVDT